MQHCFFKEDIIPVDAVDTLGAGDSYIAGFMHGVLTERKINECMKIGTETAVKTITYFGA